VGDVAPQIAVHARLTDLAVINLTYPPPSHPFARLDSGFHELVQRCPRPVLAVPQTVSPLNRALLAYDGSPKSEEALFVAAYLANKWSVPLAVVTVFEGGNVATHTLDRARAYLEKRKVEAVYFIEHGDVDNTILSAAEDFRADLIIMGGYGYNPVLDVVLGSAVDGVLRQSDMPTLICR
jgi:nucleotide-binding universal stress UspA family protein